MKSQDIVLILKLVSLNFNKKLQVQYESYGEDIFSLRSLEGKLGISKSEIYNSINRSIESGLVRKYENASVPQVNMKGLYEFIVFGLKYVFPAKPGRLTRGIPTCHSAPVLQKHIIGAGDDVMVWPYAEGEVKGQAIEPLFKSVPEAVLKDDTFYEYLALVDAIRVGNPREAHIARDMLQKRLLENG